MVVGSGIEEKRWWQGALDHDGLDCQEDSWEMLEG
jgi:hypothetical protein